MRYGVLIFFNTFSTFLRDTIKSAAVSEFFNSANILFIPWINSCVKSSVCCRRFIYSNIFAYVRCDLTGFRLKSSTESLFIFVEHASYFINVSAKSFFKTNGDSLLLLNYIPITKEAVQHFWIQHMQNLFRVSDRCHVTVFISRYKDVCICK